MRTIPLVNIGEADAIRGIERACRDTGFMYVTGHGIDAAIVENIRSTVVDYFSQPLEVKLRDRIRRDNYRGYIPAGFFNPNSGAGEVDLYEGYKLHHETAANDPIRRNCDLYGPNKWPESPAGFRAAVLTYWRECDRVAGILLGALAEILGINRGELLERFESPLTNMTLLHYPPQVANASGFGIHPHKDTDALTILAPGPVGGLYVRARDDTTWIQADPPDQALTVNIGDMLELWSGGYFVSTPHKVVNNSGRDRYSFPYFAVPRFDTVVAPLTSPQPGFARKAVHVGDVSREVWRTNWPDTQPGSPDFDLGTLDN